ncbi:uncharacterized protein LOC116307157 [Actinia tenebrosa]|uniref:Uncharacterized protein LOC116307157 n=1 Tax=Actinia tenebrosa TaxID=6105 RepID=A0A6P8J040_ACTTE|nr:uncharacterized protein LOC116307157 [Actinia tenebrosa]
MDFKEDSKRLTFRRCYSEPPLGGRLTVSSRQSNSSAQSLQEIKSTQQKNLSQKLSPGGRSGVVVRSSTFPLLPTLNNKPKKNNHFSESENNLQPSLPLFSNLITPSQRGVLQARKYQLRSRYTIDAMKAPPIKKELPSNPLRKRVQEINDDDKDISGTPKVPAEPEAELLSDLYCPYSSHQTSIRRLSVITEKSNFSRTSNKTAFFDLEDENEVNRSILPSVERTCVNKRPSHLEKNSRSRKLQEHVQMTEKQFNPLESKASLLSNWFKTLETEG